MDEARRVQNACRLEFFREGASEKHPRDIEAICRVSSELIRRDFIEGWVERLGLAPEWNRVDRQSE